MTSDTYGIITTTVVHLKKIYVYVKSIFNAISNSEKELLTGLAKKNTRLILLRQSLVWGLLKQVHYKISIVFLLFPQWVTTEVSNISEISTSKLLAKKTKTIVGLMNMSVKKKARKQWQVDWTSQKCVYTRMIKKHCHLVDGPHTNTIPNQFKHHAIIVHIVRIDITLYRYNLFIHIWVSLTIWET